MKVLLILIFFSFLVSCHDKQVEKHNDFIKKVEFIGLDKFKNIEYGTRGELESYHYCLSSDSFIPWTYNRRTEQFELPAVQKLKKLGKDHFVYIIDLRKKIQSLNILMITQAPWLGNFVRFWISDNEIIAYVNPEFKFDDRFKNEWLTELKSGQKIKDNWYYIRLEK